MILEAGFTVLILWSWPGDGPKDQPELLPTVAVHETLDACNKALARDWAQFEIELKQDAGYPGNGRAVCKRVYEFNRQEMSQ